MKKIKVYINKNDENRKVIGRKIVTVELIKERPTTVLVRLPDDNIIVRKKKDIKYDKPKK